MALPGVKGLNGKSGFGMIHDKIQDNTTINGVALFPTVFRLFFVKLRIRISNLCEMMSSRTKNPCLPSLSTKMRLLNCICCFKYTYQPQAREESLA